jgi:hypothetical protein
MKRLTTTISQHLSVCSPLALFLPLVALRRLLLPACCSSAAGGVLQARVRASGRAIENEADLHIKLIMRRQRTVLALRIIPFYVQSSTSSLMLAWKKEGAAAFCELVS